MKAAIISTVFGAFLLAFLLLGTHSWAKSRTVSVHVYDTYYVFGYSTFALLLLLVLATFFVLGGLIGSGFRNGRFMWGALLLGLLWALACWKYR